MTLLGLLSTMVLKPAVLVLVAFTLSRVMRRAEAAARHAVWVATIGAIAALPLLAAVLPNLRATGLDETVRRVSVAAVNAGRGSRLTARQMSSTSPAADQPAPGIVAKDRLRTLLFVAVATWGLVTLLLIGRRVAAEVRVHRIAVGAVGASERLTRLALRSARPWNRRVVDLRVSDRVESPAVAGLIHPIVLLPSSAESYGDADLEAVLVHEIGHVARRDCLVNLCVDLVACLYWCNPLIRFVASRVRLEAERSCDERVASVTTTLPRIAGSSGDVSNRSGARKRPAQRRRRRSGGERGAGLAGRAGRSYRGAAIRITCLAMIPMRAIAVGCTLALATTVRAQDPRWVAPFPAFKIADNIYYVGTRGLASYLVTSPQGHVLINSNLEATVPQLQASVESLGFTFKDIKILLISHAHHDHNAASAQIQRMTGAKYMVMDGDVSVVETGGRTDFQYGDSLKSDYPPAKVDRVLHDGDTVAIGDNILIARRTPGHTKGCTTWTMRARAGGKVYEAVIVGGPNVNPGYALVDNRKYPSIAADFEQSFRVLRSLPADIFLGAHGSYFDLERKYERWKRGDTTAFVDPTGYRAFLEDRERAFRAELAKQRN